MEVDDIEENILSTKEEREKAFNSYSAIIDWYTNNDISFSHDIHNEVAIAYNNRGQLYYLNVDFDEAIEDYTKAIDLNDTLAVAYYNRGQIHYRLGRYQLAIDDLSSSLQLDPHFIDAEINLKQAQRDLLLQQQDER